MLEFKLQRENDAILEVIAIESKEKGTWGDLFRDSGIAANKSFYLASWIQFMQQMAGEHRVHLHFNKATDDLQVSTIKIVTYYVPTPFQNSLGMSQERSLLTGCFLQLFYIIASFLMVCLFG